MFSDMQPIVKAAFRMLREHYETEIEGCQANIAKLQRTIKKHKSMLVYFASIEKEMVKPPKPFKPIKLNKAQRKAYRAAQARGEFPAIATVGQATRV
jgi:hypothetical protein